MKHSICTTLLCCGLALNTWGQAAWHTTIEPIEEGCTAQSGLYGPDGRLYISVLEPYGDITPARLLELDDNGSIIATGVLNYPGLKPYSANLIGQKSTDELLVLGMVAEFDPEDGDSTRAAFYRFNTDLAQLDARLIGKAGKSIGYLEGCLSPDSTVRLVYQTDDWAGNLHQYEALKIHWSGDSLTGHRIMEGMPFAPVTSLAMLPSGQALLGSSYADWGFPPTSGGTISYLTEEMELDSTYSLEHVDPSNPDRLNAPMDPVQALPLPSGNLLISGYYWADFSTHRGAVVQLTGPHAQVIGQFVADSPWDSDRPALRKAMSMAGDGTFYFAQVNGWLDGTGYNSPYPTQVQVFHLDTALGVLGSYVLDGFADSTFYSPNFVLAAPDGGAVVAGMKRNLAVPASPFQAWVARLGPESFTTAVAEWNEPVLSLYPNPSTSGFTLELRKHMEGGLIQLVDAQGRLLLSRPVHGIRAIVPAEGLASGLYTILLREQGGQVLQRLRWVKA